MQNSDFIIFLARQRSGTHAVGSVLDSHRELKYVPEIFHLEDAVSPGTDDTNFFVFLKQFIPGGSLRYIPVDHEPMFLEYLHYLRRSLTERFLLLDVKFNSVHHVLRNYQPLGGPPYLFELILRHGLRVFLLNRRNYLRYFVSVVKARAGGKFFILNGETRDLDQKVKLLVPELLLELNRCHAEDRLVAHCFTHYAAYLGRDMRDRFLTVEYDDVFPRLGAGPDPAFLECFSNWLGVANEFKPEGWFQKQSSLPLRDTIENYDEVARALRRTPFEYCLRDEQAYRPLQKKWGKRFWDSLGGSRTSPPTGSPLTSS